MLTVSVPAQLPLRQAKADRSVAHKANSIYYPAHYRQFVSLKCRKKLPDAKSIPEWCGIFKAFQENFTPPSLSS